MIPLTLFPYERPMHSPLSALTWNLAPNGARASLLPRLRGYVAYRVTRGANLAGPALAAPLQSAVRQLRRQPAGLGPSPAGRGWARSLPPACSPACTCSRR